MNRKGSWLADHARNVYSQFGEDGIIEKVFDVIPDVTKSCVEFGAWDGKFTSNTYRLISEKGWSGVLIEADKERFKELCKTYVANEQAICINRRVNFIGDSSLDVILSETPVRKNFDLLSIDIDGNDYHIWQSLQDYTPKLVVIEFNPTIPNNIEYIQEANFDVNHGSSLLAMKNLGKAKGYELVAVTDTNAFFVAGQYFPLFNIADNSTDALNQNQAYLTQVFQLYDGTIVWHGCNKLVWLDVEMKPKRLQVLPRWVRFFANRGPAILEKVTRRLFLEMYR